jgi:hypothetical protein
VPLEAELRRCAGPDHGKERARDAALEPGAISDLHQVAAVEAQPVRRPGRIGGIRAGGAAEPAVGPLPVWSVST